MNFALELAQNKITGTRVDGARFSTDPSEVVRQVLFTGARPETQASIEKALSQQKDKSGAMLAGLVLGSPDFQRR